LRFALEAHTHRRFLGPLRLQDLDGDVTAQARVARAEDATHSSAAKGREDFVGTKPIADLRKRSHGRIALRSACRDERTCAGREWHGNDSGCAIPGVHGLFCCVSNLCGSTQAGRRPAPDSHGKRPFLAQTPKSPTGRGTCPYGAHGT